MYAETELRPDRIRPRGRREPPPDPDRDPTLRLTQEEARRPHLLRLGRVDVEDAVNPVGLGDDGGVAEGVAEAHEEAGGAAPDGGRRREDGEGEAEGEQDADEQRVRELPGCRLDHRRVEVDPEDDPDEDGAEDAWAKEGRGVTRADPAPLGGSDWAA